MKDFILMRSRLQPYWGQGQYLTPQLFQQQDAFHLQRAADLYLIGRHYPWGILELEWNESALSSSVLELRRCAAVLPCGTYLRGGSAVADGNMTVPPRPAPAEARLSGAEEAGLFLAVPKVQADADCVAPVEETSQNTRYALTFFPQHDAFLPTQAPAEEIGGLQFRARLLLSCDPDFASVSACSDLLKIGEVVPGVKGVALNRRYVPPCVSAASFPSLRACLERVHLLLAERSEDFSVLKRDRGAGGSASGPQDVVRVMILHALNTALTESALAAEAPSVHPAEVYAMLRRFLGQFSAFSERWTAFGAPVETPEDRPLPYRHDQILSCVEDVSRRLERLLRGLSVGLDAGIRLRLEEDTGLYTAEPERDFFGPPDARYYLIAESCLSVDDVRNEFEHNAKIGARAAISILNQTATRGVGLRWLPCAPEEFPQRSARFMYFAVNNEGKYWQEVVKSCEVAVSTALASEKLKLTLVCSKG